MIGLAHNIALGISLAAPVGPVSVEVIRRGLQRGFVAAFTLCLGACLGDGFFLCLTYFGLAPFLMNPVARISIWLFGSGVLLYLGMQSFLGSFKEGSIKGSNIKKDRNAIVLGFLLAVINPMSVVWWLGVFGAVLGAQNPEEISFAALMSNMPILLGVLIWSLFLSTFLHFGRRFVDEKRIRLVSGLAGLSLVGFGLHFGYQALEAIFA